MTGLALAASCGGTLFHGMSNPPMLHHLARGGQTLSEELLRTAFSSAVIGTTVTLSAFYAGRALYVVPSTHSSLGMLSTLFKGYCHELLTPRDMKQVTPLVRPLPLAPIMGPPSHG